MVKGDVGGFEKGDRTTEPKYVKISVNFPFWDK